MVQNKPQTCTYTSLSLIKHDSEGLSTDIEASIAGSPPPPPNPTKINYGEKI